MIYVFPITIPANTPATAKQKNVLSLTRAHITRLMVQFPPGHCGLTHIALTMGLHQCYPTNAEAEFSTSAETIDWPEDYNLDTPPYQLESYAWNLDTVYDHTITVRVVCEALPQTTSILDELRNLLGGS